ncbi:MAG: DUF459 domain-containing protein [Devosiaceae bacterium]|nr:DUF459 domain-containing protein [Devosiaceae bacterium]
MKNKNLRFPVLLVFLLMFAFVPASTVAQSEIGVNGIEVAQQRTLFDLLFGPRETPAPTRIRRTPAPAPHVDAPRVVVPTPSIVQIPNAVEKVEGATRLAVFGDSLAIDLAKAFQREFAEDENLIVVGRGVGSSGFVRDDFYDWDAALAEEIAADNFDLAVMIIGINDRQQIGNARPLSDEWKVLYRQRVDSFLQQLRTAGKSVVWVGLPPMRAASFSSQISEISSIHRLAAIAAGVEFVDIYERFAGEDGKYSLRGPNLNGEVEVMRKSDGIHFSAAGSDKLVFYINQSMRGFYREGGVGRVAIAVADPLEGTDGLSMVRPPFQGNGQFRLLQVAGAVVQLTGDPVRANELVLAPGGGARPDIVDIEMLMAAPAGRADAFGQGIVPGEIEQDAVVLGADESEASPTSQ